jgi:adenylosuccinate lyase
MNLHAVSPIDGRYADKTKALSNYFSEYALIKYRVIVEIEYIKSLSNSNIEFLKGLKDYNTGLDEIIMNFSPEDASKIKDIEKVTNHDVKAVEYFLREKFIALGLEKYIEYIHFGLTSQDINNTAIPLMTLHYMEQSFLPQLNEVIKCISSFADEYPSVPMLAHTHGQPASPTTFKKEISVFTERLTVQLMTLQQVPYMAKFGGATGNFNAHKVTFPKIDWIDFGNNFIAGLGLNRLNTTTQIAHYDAEAQLFQTLVRINSILIDFCRDIWTYVSMDYIKQKAVANEVGSSAMPHKVNPIDFENAEGNLGIANALFSFLAEKLPISRLQRDLTDSTVLRNVGVPFAHTVVALSSIKKGVSKLSLNKEKLAADLNRNVVVLAEAVQSILRRENVEHPYELLKGLTRGKASITIEELHEFIQSLPVTDAVKAELVQIRPENYIGYAN